ncbi:universal stress protein [Haloferax namakaokahaiae]|uniref:Universal stress protein n=1 Tax=Haloferax namakaokahaiae TaxID=1748331 RepID=A0ABD5ZEH3_9EURY
MYREILVPTDGSSAADKAIEHAVSLAETYGARIHALYVVDTSIYTSLDAGADIVISALEREGKVALRQVEDAAEQAGVEVKAEVVTGTAFRSIKQYIEDHDIDLVVMGTHGRTGLDHYLLGSVTERIVRTATVPVLTVRMSSSKDLAEDERGHSTAESAG